jgi:hypothetical protein
MCKLDRKTMEKLLAGTSLEICHVLRILKAFNRVDVTRTGEIAVLFRVRGKIINEIMERFNDHGIKGLLRQLPKKPGRPLVSDTVETEARRLATHDRPPAATHWSIRDTSRRWAPVAQRLLGSCARTC